MIHQLAEAALPANCPPTDRDRRCSKTTTHPACIANGPFPVGQRPAVCDRSDFAGCLPNPCERLQLKTRRDAPKREAMYDTMNTNSEDLPKAVHYYRDPDQCAAPRHCVRIPRS